LSAPLTAWFCPRMIARVSNCLPCCNLGCRHKESLQLAGSYEQRGGGVIYENINMYLFSYPSKERGSCSSRRQDASPLPPPTEILLCKLVQTAD
jgi:hypothetical protein